MTKETHNTLGQNNLLARGKSCNLCDVRISVPRYKTKGPFAPTKKLGLDTVSGTLVNVATFKCGPQISTLKVERAWNFMKPQILHHRILAASKSNRHGDLAPEMTSYRQFKRSPTDAQPSASQRITVHGFQAWVFSQVNASDSNDLWENPGQSLVIKQLILCWLWLFSMGQSNDPSEMPGPAGPAALPILILLKGTFQLHLGRWSVQ